MHWVRRPSDWPLSPFLAAIVLLEPCKGAAQCWRRHRLDANTGAKLMILNSGKCEGLIVRSIGARVWLALAIVTLLMASFSDALAGDLDRVASFDIPAQSLDKALLEFGLQAHVQIMFSPSSSTNRLRTRALKGRYTSRDALAELLRGTGLNYSERGHTIAVAPLQSSSAGALQAAVGDADPPSPTQPDSAKPGNAAKIRKRGSYAQLQEITVTGTHIRTAEEPVLPTQTFTREDIDQSGVGTVGAFLETLPQNSASGMSETTNAAVAGGGQSGANATAGTGVNLRGVGNDATLVLIDGHRVAPADLYANFVDLSMIPLADVQRVDVITDGASAIYGADAVGGVVNVITRHGFTGAETRARYAADDRNDIHETELAQTFARDWGSGSALASYEFYDRTPLSAADRSFTQSAPQPFTLLPEQVRHSGFATISQSLSRGISLYSDAYFSHRSVNDYATIVGAFQESLPATVDAYGAILGATVSMWDSSELEVSGDYSVGDTAVQQIDYPQAVVVSNVKAKSTLATGDAILSGALWSMPAGQLLYAVGAQYRRESFETRDFIANYRFAPSRDVTAAFAELRIPVLRSSRAMGARSPTLELSVADREERYGDFGSTNNISIGVIWSPLASLRVRGTYGTSFVAPLLSETDPNPSEVAGFNTSQVPDSAPPGSGVINELIVSGGSANLKPQTARTWTVGADWHPEAYPGVLAHVSYYDLRFANRINSLQQAGYNVFQAVPIASVLGPQIVQLNPPAALVQQLVASPNFVNFGADVSNIGAIIDSRELNLSRVKTDGIDLRVSDRIAIGNVTIEPGMDASTVLHLETKFTVSSPVVAMLNTIYNPTRTKVRGHLLVERAPFSVSGFVNFVSAYTNDLTSPPTGIASWTTFDLSATYACDRCGLLLPGFSATLGVLNVLNRDPPYAANGNGFAVNYDGANSSPLGRFISLDITTRW